MEPIYAANSVVATAEARTYTVYAGDQPVLVGLSKTQMVKLAIGILATIDASATARWGNEIGAHFFGR